MGTLSRLAIGFAATAAIAVGAYQTLKVKTPEECKNDATAATKALQASTGMNVIQMAFDSRAREIAADGVKCVANYFKDQDKNIEVKAFGQHFVMRFPTFDKQ